MKNLDHSAENILPHVKNGAIYHPLLIDRFKTENGYLTDFNQTVNKKTPLEFCLNNFIEAPEIYDILFDKTVLALVSNMSIFKTIENISFFYNNQLGAKIVKYMEKIPFELRMNHFSLLEHFADFYKNHEKYFDVNQDNYNKMLEYYMNSFRSCALAVFDYRDKYNISFTEFDNFILFKALDCLDLNKNMDILSKIETNFEEKAKNIVSANHWSDFEHNLNRLKIAQEQYFLNQEVQSQNSYNKPLFKI